MTVYNYSVFKVLNRWLFRRQRDVGARVIDAVAKRELEATLRTNGFSFREAKTAVSIFVDWSKSGAQRDVEANPEHVAHPEDARDGVLTTHISPHKRNLN